MKIKVIILLVLMLAVGGCAQTTAEAEEAATLPFTATYIDTWEDNAVYQLEWNEISYGQCEVLLLTKDAEGLDATTCIEWSVYE